MARPGELPRWAETVGGSPAAGIVDPIAGKKDLGWADEEHPPAEYLNWWQHLTYLWIVWLNDWTSGGQAVDGPISIVNSLVVGTFATITTDLTAGGDTRLLKELRTDAGVVFDGILHAPSVSTDQDNYAPSGIVDGDADCAISVLYMKCTAGVQLSGIAAGQKDGQKLKLVNETTAGGNSISLVNDANSTAGNRFLLTGGITIPPDGAVDLIYDATAKSATGRWRCIGKSL